MSETFLGTIRFVNERRSTPPREVVLPVRVARHKKFLLINAGPLGSALCHLTVLWNYQGRMWQSRRKLPIVIVLQDVCVVDDRIQIVVKGYPAEILDPTEVPGIPFIRGNIVARIDCGKR